ncbi:hypothetical protein ACNKHS_07710 [Shigella flexneri]
MCIAVIGAGRAGRLQIPFSVALTNAADRTPALPLQPGTIRAGVAAATAVKHVAAAETSKETPSSSTMVRSILTDKLWIGDRG